MKAEHVLQSLIISLSFSTVIACSAGLEGLEEIQSTSEPIALEDPTSKEELSPSVPTRIVAGKFTGLAVYQASSEHFQIKQAGFAEYDFDLQEINAMLRADLFIAAQLGADFEE